jgi:O-antigen/teichoic acid export membrane protein
VPAREMKEAPALRTSAALLSGGKLLSLAVTFLTVAVMTRYLGTEGYGEYRIIIAFLALATSFADLGTPLIIARELSRPDADEERVLGNALGLRLAAVTIAVVGTGAVASLLAPRPAVVLGIFAGAVGFIAVGQHAVLFVLFQQRLRQAGAVLAETAGVVALLILAWMLTKTEAGVLAFVLGTAASSVLTVAISAVFAARLLRVRLRFEWAEWRRLLVAAMPIAATGALTLLYYRLDTVILGVVHPGAQVGLYGVPAKVLDAIIGFTLLFSGLLMPLMSRHAGSDDAKFRQFFSLGTDTLVIGTGAILLVILLHAGPIVTLIGGADFAAGAPALRVLGLMAMVASVRYMAQQAVTALNAQGRLVRGYVAAAVVGVAAYLTLIPRYGGVGAALGLLLGETVVFVWALYVLRGYGLTVAANVPLKVLVSLGATYFTWMWLEEFGLPWAFSALSAVAAYILLLLLIRGLPRHVLQLVVLVKPT